MKTQNIFAGRILVVDDERSIREALSKVLHAEDYEVVCAEHGQEAIDQFGENPIDLVLLDLGLPGEDGWGTLRWLAKVNPFVPIVVITGRNNQRELAEKAGADALMEKPLDVRQLLQTIHELINEPAEYRAERVNQGTSDFRFVPCDRERFLEMLRLRVTTPYLCSEPTHP